MATVAAIAKRRALALQRLGRASGALGEKLGVPVPNLNAPARDPAFQAAVQLEAVAGLIESIAVATGAMSREDLMSTTPEGNGPMRPNEDGYDTQLPEGAKGATADAGQGVDAGKTEESEDLSALTVAELKERAKAEGVKGYSTMNKDELVEALGG